MEQSFLRSVEVGTAARLVLHGKVRFLANSNVYKPLS
jgi:hypothetical protein